MKKRLLIVSSFTILLLLSHHAFAKKYKDKAKSVTQAEIKQSAAGCAAASSYRFLNVNNARVRINTGGDMWWDLDQFSQYFIPANGTATSMYAGSLWIGGLDINGQLKLNS